MSVEPTLSTAAAPDDRGGADRVQRAGPVRLLAGTAEGYENGNPADPVTAQALADRVARR
jgi:hypothetical protein